MPLDPQAQLIDLLNNSRSILLFTGAGISTGSGIPDFRGPDGVWKRRQPVYYQDFMRSDAARIEHWEYKLEGWPGFRAARPNATHLAAVELEHSGKLVAIVTQNIDGLHQRAGSSPDKVIELHGTNAFVECQSCGKLTDPEPSFAEFEKTHKCPLCSCGGFLKPATISFGQNLKNSVLEAAEAVATKADLVIAMGSTLSVNPAASIPLLAAAKGATYIVINRGPTDHDDNEAVTLRLEGDVTGIFPPAVASLKTA
jgi:NAD-dependent deacetylase